MENTSSIWEKLKVGDFIELKSANCEKNTQAFKGTITSKRCLNLKGITLQLDKGGQMFISKSTLHLWKIRKL